MLAKAPNVIVVHPSVPVKSVKELIALAKAKPGALNYGSGGTGSSRCIWLQNCSSRWRQSTCAHQLQRHRTGDQRSDRRPGAHGVRNRRNRSCAHVSSGRLRALAVTSPQPSALAPGLPTVAASGVPGYEMEAIYAVVAPANTPAPVIKQLNQVIVRSLASRT